MPSACAKASLTASATSALDSAFRAVCAAPRETDRLLGLVRAGAGIAGHDDGGDRSEEGCGWPDWTAWGLLELTGEPGRPAVPEAPVAARIAAALGALSELAGELRAQLSPDAGAILADRAAEAGWTGRGAVSVNGSARLLPAVDGWIAVNLARPEDVEVLPALLGRPLATDPWSEVAAFARTRPAAPTAEALQLVGVPAAVLSSVAGGSPFRFEQVGLSEEQRRSARELVVLNLSAMWAGPLCARVLADVGARVITAEDVRRPDGARFGPPAFYAQLHAGQAEERFDLATPAGRARLHALVETADIVIEGSRPRALRRLGVVAEEFLAVRPGRTWVSITGYGRATHDGNRVAFGDDAAAAGGLVARDEDGRPVFCGDAIADPLTGIYSALAALASIRAGGGHLVDVAMARVAADVARPADRAAQGHRLTHDDAGWHLHHDSSAAS